MSEKFNIELVPAKNPALQSMATVNPFDDKDANWEERELEMITLMHDRMGVGLAAPQIGVFTIQRY